ncbi:hypothetical protein E0H71_00365 [Rhizobium leguminosarum bv. viciae]|uniref:hypothetical protein n=1 Tax=Rhizobium leguminosarum TaxID=384 RepID=UPI00103AE8E3|nr:hypothetical protein [Rhizobium leguminosarum]TCA58090.1 hypothetical protein E0H71_00365 [Rhizobium leguminosarum bv. viciae]
MRNLISLGITCLSLSLASGPAKCDVMFDYVRGSPVSLGRSVDARLPTESKKDCLSSTEWEWIESDVAATGSPGGVLQVGVTGEYIDDYQELFRRLHFNASFKGSATIKAAVTLGMDAGFSYDNEFAGKYTNLSYVLMAQYDFGSRRLKRPTLEPFYQNLIDAGKYAQFISECGTHFAISEQRWSYAAIIVHLSKLDESMKQLLKANYTSKADVVKIGSGEISLDAEGEFRTAHKYAKATLDFSASGGDSTKAAKLAGAANTGDMSAALSAMESYMTGISRDTSAVQSYRLASFEMFGLKIPAGADISDFMESAYFAGLRYEQIIAAIQESVVQAEKVPALTVALRESLNRDLYRITQEKLGLDRLAVACLETNICDSHDIAKVAPTLGYNTSLLSSASLSASCLYTDDKLAEVSLRLTGSFIDPKAVQDFQVYRIPDYPGGKPDQVLVRRTGLAEDPAGHRFVASIDHLKDNPDSNLTLPEEARATRYQMSVIGYDGGVEWYNLGKIALPADDCPGSANTELNFNLPQ